VLGPSSTAKRSARLRPFSFVMNVRSEDVKPVAASEFTICFRKLSAIVPFFFRDIFCGDGHKSRFFIKLRNKFYFTLLFCTRVDWAPWSAETQRSFYRQCLPGRHSTSTRGLGRRRAVGSNQSAAMSQQPCLLLMDPCGERGGRPRRRLRIAPPLAPAASRRIHVNIAASAWACFAFQSLNRSRTEQTPHLQSNALQP
jgi:hypothetical protein